MRQEASADVTRAVAARRRAGHALRLPGLPRELNAIQVSVLLPLGCDGASGRASVGRVLPCHMTLTVTSRDRTPEGGKKAYFHHTGDNVLSVTCEPELVLPQR